MQMKTKVKLLAMAVLAVVAGCKYEREAKSVSPFSDEKAALLGLLCEAEPGKVELLDESGTLALFAGETPEDSAFNKEEREIHPSLPCLRNSLFLRRRMADGSYQWRFLLTTDSDWRVPDGMGKWCSLHAQGLKDCFFVDKASFASDGRHLWLVCDPQTYTFHVICSYDVYDRTFRVLTDGYTAVEEPDGTIKVEDKKIYLEDKNGEPLGAAWYDVWISPDGTVVRKGEITQKGSDL